MRTAAIACLVLAMAVALSAAPADFSGVVTFGQLAVPGATVTATHSDRSVSVSSSDDGSFTFVGLEDGVWAIRVEMRGFVTLTREVTVPSTAPAAAFALALQSYADMLAAARNQPAATTNAPATPTAAPDQVDVVTGSVVNGATTVYAQPRAFGNNRPKGPALYNFGLTVVGGDSAWNARPYTFAGASPPVPSYGDVQVGFNLAGPLRIPGLVRYGPSMQLGYQHSVSHDATTRSALMPTAAERAGDFSAASTVIRDPLTGLPFPGNAIPADRISPQAAALLQLYPLPNTDNPDANFERAIVTATTSDRFQFGMNHSWRNRVSMDGNVAWQHSSTQAVNLFDFNDRSSQSAIAVNLNLSRQYSARLVLRLRYQFNYTGASETPFFAGRANVSGDAGIVGNDQSPESWGPPSLVFPGIEGLIDGTPQRTASTTHAPGGEVLLRHNGHNVTIGGDYRWNTVGVDSQPNPRGTLTFTGAATGDSFADFLLGLPTASSIAFGNTATHLSDVAPDVYVNDDWRLLANLTVNAGLRWEYDAPFAEASGRLANLDIAPGFAAVAPVLGNAPEGTLTGARYPSSLIQPDKSGFEPRVGASWRPSLASPLVVKASYGLYRNLGGYQALALLMAQQQPFAKAFTIQNSALTPLTLAAPFPESTATANTIAIDPNFRAAMAHNWEVTVQRELPASLTVIASYLGAKGSHLLQASLPNTVPPGSPLAPTGPSGYVYLASNGTSLRNAMQLELRRRLYAGFTASVQYLLSKSTDDASSFSNGTITPGTISLAQNWLDLGAERGPSSFDQRHHVTGSVQYTTGVGLKGGTLVDGFWGSLWKDWTVATQVTAGSGLPFTPVAFLPIAGTGVVGVRPSLTGISATPITAGTYANPDAFALPQAGEWGTAGRNSLRGPATFSMDLSLSRVFRLGNRLNLEYRVAATNVLNRVTFASIDPIVGSAQFGRPMVANPMRALKMTVRLRF